MSLCATVKGKEKGLLVLLHVQIEGQMASQANHSDCHLLVPPPWEEGEGLCVCVCVCMGVFVCTRRSQ